MPEYSYVAMTRTGQRTQGTVPGNSEREAMYNIDAKGLCPISIAPIKAAGGTFGRGGRVKTRHVCTFYSGLADLLHSGVPLLRSLEILENQAGSPALAEVIREVRAKVADGKGLAEAMAYHQRAFTELAVSIIRAGQEGGFLEDALRRIAEFTEQQEDLKSKVIGALAYPVFLAVIGVIILNVLIIFFVPKFQSMFDDMGSSLPPLTSALISVSHFMRDFWWLIIIVLIGAFFALHQWAKSESGRFTLDGWRLKLPGVGRIYLNLAIARFSRILGTLLQNGIPILQALRVAKDSTGNKVLSQAIDRSAENLKAGESLTKPLAASRYFPRDVVEIVAVGEESNSLEKVLLDIALGLEKRTSRQLELFVKLLEPMMLLVMAGLTLIVVLGLLLPVFKSTGAAG